MIGSPLPETTAEDPAEEQGRVGKMSTAVDTGRRNMETTEDTAFPRRRA